MVHVSKEQSFYETNSYLVDMATIQVRTLTDHLIYAVVKG